MKEIIDSSIIAGFSKGSETAFRKIYDHLYPQLKYFADKLTGDPEESKDIVIDTFAKLFQRYQLFDSFVNIRAFLYISVRNKCFDYLKMTQRQSARNKEFASQMEDDTNLEYEQVFNETLQRIFAAVEDLPTKCKKVFKLIYFKGMKTTAIAEMLNISESTVWSQKSRALKLLRMVLTEKQLLIACTLCCSGYMQCILEEVL